MNRGVKKMGHDVTTLNNIRRHRRHPKRACYPANRDPASMSVINFRSSNYRCAPQKNKNKPKKNIERTRAFFVFLAAKPNLMKNVQLLKGGLLRTAAVLLAIFFAIVCNVSAQGPSPAPAGPRDAQGNLLPPSTAATATAERVIVTGSNIPTAEEVGPNPVETYTHDDMQKSGLRNTEQFLQSQPIVNSNVVPVSNNENGSNTAVGAATISLRGLDPRATLILIDGRRVAPYPVGNNPGPVNAMFVDLNSIPQAAIESVEILKDGASTVYGADAVAGVVNLKMRHYFDGAEAMIEYGNTEHEDSGLFQASVIFGVGNNNTEIAGAMNYYMRNSIANRDRSYSAVPPFLSSNASPYNLQLSGAVAAAAGGQNLAPIEFAA